MHWIIVILGTFFSSAALGVCPICTFVVGAGIGLTQYLGIDDTISGTWVGGLVVSMIVWTTYWLSKRHIRFFGRKILIVVGYYALTIYPLYKLGLLGHELNKIWGYDKLLFGIFAGSVTFALGTITYELMKKHHDDKAYFPLQKVVMPILPLIILSTAFYFLTK